MVEEIFLTSHCEDPDKKADISAREHDSLLIILTFFFALFPTSPNTNTQNDQVKYNNGH